MYYTGHFLEGEVLINFSVLIVTEVCFSESIATFISFINACCASEFAVGGVNRPSRSDFHFLKTSFLSHVMSPFSNSTS